MKPRRAFTLIELLVVIAIVALVLGILLPSLSRTREQARERLCGSRERQQVMVMTLYAQDNDNKLPPPVSAEGGLWQLETRIAQFMLDQGISKDLFFCPSNRTQQEYMELYWQPRVQGGGLLTRERSAPRDIELAIAPSPTPPAPEPELPSVGFVVSGYCYLLDSAETPRPPILNRENKTGAKKWPRTLLEKNGGRVELVVDATLSEAEGDTEQSGRFAAVAGGVLWESHQVADQSSHLKSADRPLGGNVGYLDGHVAWRPFDDMEPRYTLAPSQTFWW